MVRISIARPSSDHENRHAIYCAKYVVPKERQNAYSVTLDWVPIMTELVTRGWPHYQEISSNRSPGMRSASPQWYPHKSVTSHFTIWQLGEGKEVFQNAKQALKRWDQFQLDWARVNPETPLFIHYAYCNSVKVVLLWMINPLRVEYVDSVNKTVNGGMSFAYGTTTLHGHMLQGEERFKIDWNKVDNTVKWIMCLNAMRKCV